MSNKPAMLGGLMHITMTYTITVKSTFLGINDRNVIDVITSSEKYSVETRVTSMGVEITTAAVGGTVYTRTGKFSRKSKIASVIIMSPTVGYRWIGTAMHIECTAAIPATVSLRGGASVAYDLTVPSFSRSFTVRCSSTRSVPLYRYPGDDSKNARLLMYSCSVPLPARTPVLHFNYRLLTHAELYDSIESVSMPMLRPIASVPVREFVLQLTRLREQLELMLVVDDSVIEILVQLDKKDALTIAKVLKRFISLSYVDYTDSDLPINRRQIKDIKHPVNMRDRLNATNDKLARIKGSL